MNQTEKTIETKSIFQGRIIQVRVDQVRLPDGRVSTREVVEHAPAVAIVAVNDQDQIVLIRQYRKPVEQQMLEIPAGIMETGELPLEAAKRELAEETGWWGGVWKEVGSFYTAPGFTDEKIYLFMVTDMVQGERNLDEDEFIELENVSLKTAQEYIQSGQIIDAKTIIGIQAALLVRY
ncbi:MAG: NUDIX hydrolase [Bacillota bacterium]|nr:NUDIX hydrolase [Bacillota bacterium]